MKMHRFKRILSLLLVAALLAGFYVPGAQAASTGLSWKETDQPIRLDLTHREVKEKSEPLYQNSDVVRVSIILEEPSTIQAGFGTRNIAGNAQALAYGNSLKAKQDDLAAAISAQVLDGKKLDVVWNLTLAANLISARIAYGHIEAIAQMDGVKAVILENRYEPCVVEREDVAQPQMYASLGMTGSSLTWGTGFTGAGSRVAVVDTGTDTTHQSLNSGAYLYALEQNAAAAGLSYEEYVAGLDLLDAQEIASVLPYLKISERISGVTAEDLYLNEKLPFAANYVDSNLIVDHLSDYQGEHGSHVAGIAAANRYIPNGTGYADALQAVSMAGVAPDAQLLTMKVFGEGSPYDSDYMAAIEDAIYLNCDSVNLSLGTSSAGMSYNAYYNDLLEYMSQTDTVVVASAGNSYNWPVASTFGYLYHDDVSFDIVGAPGSHTNFFTVASVENDGGVLPAFLVDGNAMLYGEVTGYGNTALGTLDASGDGTGTEYDYVFIDGLGYAEDYAGMDLTNKVVFCSRGTLNFAVKANNAMDLGAAAVIVYNNASDGIFGMNLSGINYGRPCVSLSQQDADLIRSLSAQQTTSGGLTYYTGKLTILASPLGFRNNSEYYTMSDFSSWGVPGTLELKPEITAPGGNIYSLWGSNAVSGGGADQYEVMSGTSMAAPAITGMAALVAQYLRETGLAEQEGMKVRHLAQSLLMSTAEPLFEEASEGNYYSLMNQGAGMARVDLAVAAESYILVDGQPDGKVKAELGDDPERTGVYTFSFSLNNLTDKAQSYLLSADVFRQDMFEYQPDSDIFLLDTWTASLPAAATFCVNGVPVNQDEGMEEYDLNGDGITNTLDADYLLEYLLGNETQIYGEADVSNDGMVSSYDAHVLLALLESSAPSAVNLPAGGSVTVDVTLTLTAEGRQILEDNYPNGTYVEAFVYAEEITDEEGIVGTVHSIPVLAFYGNWSDPSMYDRGSLLDLVYMTSNVAPYLYRVIGPYGNALSIDYGNGTEYYFGGNPYLDDETYLPERNAFNSQDASFLGEQSFTLIRNATAGQIVISNAETGEEYMVKTMGDMYSAYYVPAYGQWANTAQYAKLNWKGKDASGTPVAEDTLVDVTVTTIPEYYRNEDGTHNVDNLGKGTKLSTQFYIDNTAPTALKIEQTSETTLSVTVQDNRYVAAVALLNAAGTSLLTSQSPNQTEMGVTTTMELDLTDLMGESFLLLVGDYAMNNTVYEITLELPEIERDYFTAIDYSTMDYVGMNDAGEVTHIVSTGLPLLARAAEYVGGYVFIITEDNSLCVANDEDLSSTYRICQLDPDSQLLITGFNDMAYNYADGKLYAQFYSQFNYEATPYLCTIDMHNGDIEVICELPVDVNTMAIDTEGNFYSAGYAQNTLYTYTLADVTSETPTMTYIGEMGYYYASQLTSMAWDHNTGKLYWAFPNTLVEINPETAEPTLLGYHEELLVGLYTRPEEDEGMFDPVNTVDRVELNYTDTRVLLGYTLSLESTVWPWNASDRSVTWTSSDPDVASVDSNGLVTGNALGTAVITATSNLDPTKTATCTITVESLPVKKLNAIVWDENGEIWMSEFTTDDLPNYTKLHDTSLGLDLAAATVNEEGVIYAASLDVDTLGSDLYKLDPTTFEPTLIGPSTDGYVDLAPAPGMPGNSLGAVYGGNMLFVDADNGDYYTWFNMFSYNLVGLAYVGTMEYKEWGYDTMVDWYFIIDRVGYVYLLGFLEQDGSYYYLEHDQLAPGGIYTTLDFEMETAYFGSAYFDGQYLYYSAYKESTDNVTLMAIDVAGGSKSCYTLGTFDTSVWPVAGLMELGLSDLPTFMSTPNGAKPQAPNNEVELSSLALGQKKAEAAGGLNAASGDLVISPKSAGEFEQDTELVVVTLTGANSLSGSTNGRMTLSYNAEELELVRVAGTTEAFAYAQGDGTVDVAYASAAEIAADAPVATLTFRVLKSGEHEIVVRHHECDDEPSGKEEYIYVASGCSHDFTAVVTEPTCESQGYTTYTCTKCGESYVADYTDPVDHVYEDGHCKWCGKDEQYVRWYSATTSLNGTIDLNIYVILSKDLVEADDTYVRFIHNGNILEVPMAEALYSPIEGYENRYRFSCPIYAKQLADKVTVTFMKGDQQIGKTLSYSVVDYCVNQIAKVTDPQELALYKAMLNYGAAAQLLFNHNVENLANASLSDADKVLPTVDASAYKYAISGKEEGIRAKSATLMLEDVVKVRVYFALTGTKTIEDYTFTIDGKVVTPQQNEKGWYVETDGIAAKDLEKMFSVQVGGITVKYGALSFVNSKANSSNELEANIAKALFVYWQAAESYLG